MFSLKKNIDKISVYLLTVDKAKESVTSDNVTLKTKGLPTYSINNVYGSVPLNQEGSDLTSYPTVFLYSSFNFWSEQKFLKS